MRIALLEDTETDAARVKDCLATTGHSCHHYNNGKRLISALMHESFDVLILDWNVPGMDGSEVLQWVRKNLPSPPPVLFVSARDNEMDTVEALVNGADDYLIKPVRCAELLARINTCVRRVYKAEAATTPFEYGDWTFQPSVRGASFRSEALDLTGKEFELAQFLFRNIGRLLSRGHILESVWGLGKEVPTRTLDTHISRVRLKCKLFPEHGLRLVSIYGYGYRLEQATPVNQ